MTSPRCRLVVPTWAEAWTSSPRFSQCEERAAFGPPSLIHGGSGGLVGVVGWQGPPHHCGFTWALGVEHRVAVWGNWARPSTGCRRTTRLRRASAEGRGWNQPHPASETSVLEAGSWHPIGREAGGRVRHATYGLWLTPTPPLHSDFASSGTHAPVGPRSCGRARRRSPVAPRGAGLPW